MPVKGEDARQYQNVGIFAGNRVCIVEKNEMMSVIFEFL